MSKLRQNVYKKVTFSFIGIVLCFVLFELILRLVGYIYVLNQDRYNQISLQKKADYTILALGESTTEIGGESSWPRQLEKVLSQKMPNKKFTVINKGRSGTNSYKILSELEENLNKYKPDIVITMMGVNDGAVPDLKVYDEAFKINIAKTPDEKHLPFNLDQLKTYKFFNLCRVLIQKEFVKLHSKANIALPVFAANSLESDTEEYFLKELKLNPNNYEALVGLGDYYKHQTFDDMGRHLDTGTQIMDYKAEQMYKKAIDIAPQYPLAYKKLGIHMRDMSRYEESEWAIKKIIELNPRDTEAYLQLGWTYIYWNKYNQGEKVLKDILSVHPDNKLAYNELEVLYRQMGDEDKANEVSGKVLGLNSASVSNYRKLKEVVMKRGIKLVAVQYPTRDIAILKNIVGTDNVIFVDNEKVFKDAVKNEGYGTYFADKFAGNFGHGTDKGNYLLASNIANMIIKEVFR